MGKSSGSKPSARKVIASIFEYDTPMIVHIQNLRIGIINRLVQLTIVLYIIGYAIIYEKGYQEFDEVKSAISTKIKGIGFTNVTNMRPITLDVADYVIPPMETNAFFITTGIIQSMNQKQGFCGEDPNVKKAICQTDSQCQQYKGMILSNGPITGRCVNSTVPGPAKTCEIYGWCPIEDDNLNRMIIFNGTENFTVLIKNNVEFPKFQITRRNILDYYKNDADLSSCRWNRHDPLLQYCPIFILRDITNDVGVNFASLLESGGIMKIIIDWTCDLDRNIKNCVPKYSFSRLDKGNYTSSVGFNFRYADHFSVTEPDGTQTIRRNLQKVYGVRFLIEVRGHAGKFHIVPLILNIGNGMALLGIASVLCDIIIQYISKSRELYKGKKFLRITEDEIEASRHQTDDRHKTDKKSLIVDGDEHAGEDNTVS